MGSIKFGKPVDDAAGGRQLTVAGWVFRGFMVFLCGFLSMCMFSAVVFTLIPIVNMYGYAAFSYDQQIFYCYFALPFAVLDLAMFVAGLWLIRKMVKAAWKAGLKVSARYFEGPQGRKGDSE